MCGYTGSRSIGTYVRVQDGLRLLGHMHEGLVIVLLQFIGWEHTRTLDYIIT